MTTGYEMEMAYSDQQEVIAILNELGDSNLAARLERCMAARQFGIALALTHRS
jgi:hypothetical protein